MVQGTPLHHLPDPLCVFASISFMVLCVYIFLKLQRLRWRHYATLYSRHFGTKLQRKTFIESEHLILIQ